MTRQRAELRCCYCRTSWRHSTSCPAVLPLAISKNIKTTAQELRCFIYPRRCYNGERYLAKRRARLRYRLRDREKIGVYDSALACQLLTKRRIESGCPFARLALGAPPSQCTPGKSASSFCVWLQSGYVAVAVGLGRCPPRDRNQLSPSEDGLLLLRFW
ncbi:LAQU0S16e00298g1_1 [Lachancea quebecensis]|uniref:LAQU0S16e00298g1_1 n=1 Tax=Lachancea quebecensis TaxID=1654605 RepID=A0A0P1KWH6_9SACH|nr:LAQU0S16e00298g1_1 [Lachancea quebecensis]